MSASALTAATTDSELALTAYRASRALETSAASTNSRTQRSTQAIKSTGSAGSSTRTASDAVQVPTLRSTLLENSTLSPIAPKDCVQGDSHRTTYLEYPRGHSSSAETETTAFARMSSDSSYELRS